MLDKDVRAAFSTSHPSQGDNRQPAEGSKLEPEYNSGLDPSDNRQHYVDRQTR